LMGVLDPRMPTTHGYARGKKTVEYRTWQRMLNRCRSKKDAKHYRERGITVCPRWAGSFEAFLADMGPRPSDKTSIERKEGTKGYEPGNCVWATTQEQNWNKSDTRLVTLHGETFPLSVWADRLGLKRGTIHNRVKMGWTEEDALLTPIGQPNPHPRVRMWVSIAMMGQGRLKRRGTVTNEGLARILAALESEGLI